MSTQSIVSVTAVCPFCGGSAALLGEQAGNLTTADVADRFGGRQIVCQHPGCEKTFWVRRTDLVIRRRSSS